ncbi:MAG TPA: hypothetical protein VGZ00_12545 [Candidatus Baltobacteraceae bacterium]|jgi:hypothetical protein|nr:hypothetical protein [Candidatus Baltobacteraceae bacterium]
MSEESSRENISSSPHEGQCRLATDEAAGQFRSILELRDRSVILKELHHALGAYEAPDEDSTAFHTGNLVSVNVRILEVLLDMRELLVHLVESGGASVEVRRERRSGAFRKGPQYRDME